MLYMYPMKVNNNIPAQQVPTVQGEIRTQDNHFLYYEKYGDGEPIVVLHGGPGLSSTYLLPSMLELSKDYSLIFYDQRGSGQSSGAIDDKTMNVAQFVKDLEDIRCFFKLDKMTLLGHSWGAMLAMHYAIEHQNNVSQLVLLNSLPAQVDNNDPDMYRAMIGEIVSSKDKNNENMRNLYRDTFKLFFIEPSKIEQLNLTMTDQEIVNSAIIHQFFENSYDISQQLTQLMTKTLIIHGCKNDIPITDAQKLNSLIQNSTLQVLETGHFPFIEAPEALFAHIRDFMASELKNRHMKL